MIATTKSVDPLGSASTTQYGAESDSINHHGNKITTLKLEKEYFEEAEKSIVEFSQLITAENDKKKKHHIDPSDGELLVYKSRP